MGYYLAHSPCYLCKCLCSYNPHKVPSLRIKNGKLDPAGEREPVCESCMRAINRDRKLKGLEPFPILPGAYEPADELE
jgi:hypothetical protein